MTNLTKLSKKIIGLLDAPAATSAQHGQFINQMERYLHARSVCRGIPRSPNGDVKNVRCFLTQHEYTEETAARALETFAKA